MTGHPAVARVLRWQWPRDFPIVQFPNAPLGLGLIASVVARFTDGTFHDVAFAVATAGYAAWAAWELAGGANWFRRLLGVAALAWVVVRVF